MSREGLGSVIFYTLYFFTLFSFALSVVYVFFVPTYNDADRRLMLFQSCVGLLSVNLPYFLSRGFAWKIPTFISSLYFLFLWGSIFLGEILHFYYLVPAWDDVMHFVSAVLLGIFGLSLSLLLEQQSDSSHNGQVKESVREHRALHRLIIAVSFAVFVGVLWEIFEYLCDGILGINMQKFAFPSDTELVPLLGRAALTDTMQDLIVDLVGALTVAAPGAFFIRRYPKILPSVTIAFSQKRPEKGK